MLQDDGNLTVVNPQGVAVWESLRVAVPNRLQVGGSLVLGQALVSPSGTFTLELQADGNLVLLDNGAPTWASNTSQPTGFALMQWDGNFVLYEAGGQVPVFDTATDTPGNSIYMQDDGNLVVYNPAAQPMWDSTAHSVAIRSFSANPVEAVLCSGFTLSWDVVNAQSVELKQPDGTVNTVAAVGSQGFQVASGGNTGAFTLTASSGIVSHASTVDVALSVPVCISQFIINNQSGEDIDVVVVYEDNSTVQGGAFSDGESLTFSAATVGECQVASLQGFNDQEPDIASWQILPVLWNTQHGQTADATWGPVN